MSENEINQEGLPIEDRDKQRVLRGIVNYLEGKSLSVDQIVHILESKGFEQAEKAKAMPWLLQRKFQIEKNAKPREVFKPGSDYVAKTVEKFFKQGLKDSLHIYTVVHESRTRDGFFKKVLKELPYYDPKFFHETFDPFNSTEEQNQAISNTMVQIFERLSKVYILPLSQLRTDNELMRTRPNQLQVKLSEPRYQKVPDFLKNIYLQKDRIPFEPIFTDEAKIINQTEKVLEPRQLYQLSIGLYVFFHILNEAGVHRSNENIRETEQLVNRSVDYIFQHYFIVQTDRDKGEQVSLKKNSETHIQYLLRSMAVLSFCQGEGIRSLGNLIKNIGVNERLYFDKFQKTMR